MIKHPESFIIKKNQNMKSLSVIGQILIAIFALLFVECGKTANEHPNTDFFGVNLDEESNQVEHLHNLLLAGKVEYEGIVLKEWTDLIGSDYMLTEGKAVSMTITHGNVEDVKTIRDKLNLSFSERFATKGHYVQNEWGQTESGDYYMEYFDLYEYGNYNIGIHYRVFSPSHDEQDLTSAEIRVGLANGGDL